MAMEIRPKPARTLLLERVLPWVRGGALAGAR
jgi:hypothetical protein